MNSKKSTSCGAITLLNELRQSQELTTIESEASKEPSRIDNYIKDSKSKKNIQANHKEDSIIINEIHELDTNVIICWQYKDRPNDELGDILELAETFKLIGQQQPGIVRPAKNQLGKFELIVGERRWRAAASAGMKLKVIIRDIDDRMAALVQAIENDKRADISEYAKGMSYANKIELGLISQSDLVDILKVRKEQVTRLLSYKKIPQPLFEAIGDFKKVSARTAYELTRISSKGEEYIKCLIELAPEIRSGKYGHNSINREINKTLSKKDNSNKIKSNCKVLSKDGRHIFTWRLDNNSNPSIHFPKDIIQLINKEDINFDEITQEFKDCIIKKLSSLKH